MQTNDLEVLPTSEALRGRQLDLIVTGSIAAVESVRFVRALRRLGANVHVWLSNGGAQFIAPMALEWASAQSVRTDFSGTASHLAERDACIIAPASSNFLRKLAQGITDSPTSALAASYLGAKRPVLILPNMHQSLAHAPAVAANLATVSQWATILEARTEEGKQKFPDPATLADRVAHTLNKNNKTVLVAFGGTKAQIDDVRFIANYSSGALGSLVCEELYRLGFIVDALQGTVSQTPRVTSTLTHAETYQAMHDKAVQHCQDGVDAIVFMTSVLDYIPADTMSGKLRSGKASVALELKPTEKILPKLTSRSGVKIGFKLESSITQNEANAVAERYIKDNQLSLFVVNQLKDVSAQSHRAWVYDTNSNMVSIESKDALAKAIARHIQSRLLGG